jgi:hypothetical protein
MPTRAVAADADDLGAERGELRVVPPEITRLDGSTRCEILRIEIQHDRPLAEPIA